MLKQLSLSSENIKRFGIWATICIFTAVGFSAYLVFIGIPKTNARNYYNQGTEYIREGEISKGISLMEIAITYWPEEYIIKELDQIRRLLY